MARETDEWRAALEDDLTVSTTLRLLYVVIIM